VAHAERREVSAPALLAELGPDTLTPMTVAPWAFVEGVAKYLEVANERGRANA